MAFYLSWSLRHPSHHSSCPSLQCLHILPTHVYDPQADDPITRVHDLLTYVPGPLTHIHGLLTSVHDVLTHFHDPLTHVHDL